MDVFNADIRSVKLKLNVGEIPDALHASCDQPLIGLYMVLLLKTHAVSVSRSRCLSSKVSTGVPPTGRVNA